MINKITVISAALVSSLNLGVSMEEGNIDDPPPPLPSSIVEELLDEDIPDHIPFKSREDELEAEVSNLKTLLSEKEDEIEGIKEERKIEEDSNDEMAKRNSHRTDVHGSSKDSNNNRQDDGQEEQKESLGTFEATYYTAYCDTCDENAITANGDDISESIFVDGDRVIAVDPDVISLGSTVEVSTGSETFKAEAVDTGGDINGNRIDILVESEEEAQELGRQDVEVSIID